MCWKNFTIWKKRSKITIRNENSKYIKHKNIYIYKTILSYYLKYKKIKKVAIQIL